MPYYAITIADNHGVSDIITIQSDDKNACAEYIKTHVRKLYYPFFDIIVRNVIGDKYESIDDSGFCAFIKGLDADEDQYDDEEFFIPHIKKFLKKLSTNTIFSIFNFYEGSGNKEDAVLKIMEYKSHISI